MRKRAGKFDQTLYPPHPTLLAFRAARYDLVRCGTVWWSEDEMTGRPKPLTHFKPSYHWCRWWGSNPHGVATTRFWYPPQVGPDHEIRTHTPLGTGTWSQRVCLFRHVRINNFFQVVSYVHKMMNMISNMIWFWISLCVNHCSIFAVLQHPT